MEQETGLVIKTISGFFTIRLQSGEDVIAKIPGRLKKGQKVTDLVAIGDSVTISLPDEKANSERFWRIDQVAPRLSVLSRTRPSGHSHRNLDEDQEQVLIANPDQVVFVFSIAKPHPSLRKLDRFLVVAELNQLPTIICVNKIDLVAAGEAEEMFRIYEEIGYQLLYTSATTNVGIDQLRNLLQGKISVLAGSSGVGKSTLLNQVESGLALKVGAVSEATTKGQHTTRHAELIPLTMGGFVADTPGIRGLALFDVEPTELDAYFKEIAPLVEFCPFSDCRHEHEKKCAVIQAVKDGTVSPQRYDSYLRLREEHELLEAKRY